MVKIIFKDENNESIKENRINQGDYVFCEAEDGAHHIWGIYSAWIGAVVALNGGGSSYIVGKEIYLGEKYSYWRITKRIPSHRVKLTIEEIK